MNIGLLISLFGLILAGIFIFCLALLFRKGKDPWWLVLFFSACSSVVFYFLSLGLISGLIKGLGITCGSFVFTGNADCGFETTIYTFIEGPFLAALIFVLASFFGLTASYVKNKNKGHFIQLALFIVALVVIAVFASKILGFI